MVPYIPLALTIVSAATLAAGIRSVHLPVRYTKNGGMRFLRVARLQMSWCVCRKSI